MEAVGRSTGASFICREKRAAPSAAVTLRTGRTGQGTRSCRRYGAGRAFPSQVRDLIRAISQAIETATTRGGFSSQDITLVVGRWHRGAVAWLPPERVEVSVLLAALAAALGIHEPGITYPAFDLPASAAEQYRDRDQIVAVTPPAWPDYAWHAPLLVADLLPLAAAPVGRR